MGVALRISVEHVVQINNQYLNPRIGCGLMFTKIPAYHGNDVFRQIMSAYGFERINADKPAAKVLDESESLMRTFVANAEANKMPLKQNFRLVYAPKDLYLALDAPKKTAYFMGATENKLTLGNYYRDVMPQLAVSLKLPFGGATGRLTQAGWQNLHDVINDINFHSDFPEVDRVEVMAAIPDVRWRKPLLELGVHILNFSDPRAIRRAISQAIKGFSDL